MFHVKHWGIIILLTTALFVATLAAGWHSRHSRRGLAGDFGFRQFAPLQLAAFHRPVMRMGLSMVFAARAAEEKENRLSVLGHQSFPFGKSGFAPTITMIDGSSGSLKKRGADSGPCVKILSVNRALTRQLAARLSCESAAASSSLIIINSPVRVRLMCCGSVVTLGSQCASLKIWTKSITKSFSSGSSNLAST